MSNAVTVKGYVYLMDFGHGDPEYVMFTSDRQGDKYYTLIGPAEFAYDIPADFNPVAAKLSALEAEKQKIRAAFAAKVAEIDDAINKLQALEMTVEAA